MSTHTVLYLIFILSQQMATYLKVIFSQFLCINVRIVHVFIKNIVCLLTVN